MVACDNDRCPIQVRTTLFDDRDGLATQMTAFVHSGGISDVLALPRLPQARGIASCAAIDVIDKERRMK